MLTTWLFILTGTAWAAGERTLVWTGIDYGLVRLVGTLDFRDPSAIFPGYFNTWNGLFVEEQLDELEARTKVSAIVTSLSHLGDLHRVADPNTQIVRDDSFPVTDELPAQLIRDRVKSYALRETEGTALALIADQLHKPNQLGCFWVVRYDVATRDVHSLVRACEPAHGFGFRNYWFGSVKDVVSQLAAVR